MGAIHNRILGQALYCAAACDGLEMARPINIYEVYINGETKSAAFGVDSLTQAGDHAANAILVTSLLLGVPTGVAAHVVSQAVKRRSAEEGELKGRIKYYQEATKGLGNALQPATEDLSNVQ